MVQRAKESERLWAELERVAKNHRLPERTIMGMFDAALGFRVRNATYRAILDGEITDATASRDLRRMVQVGVLLPKGQKRGRHYIASPVIARIRQAIIDSRDVRDTTDPFADTA